MLGALQRYDCTNRSPAASHCKTRQDKVKVKVRKADSHSAIKPMHFRTLGRYRNCIIIIITRNIDAVTLQLRLEPGVDGLKRLRLTPQLLSDWLVDASHFFPTAATRQFLWRRLQHDWFQKFPTVIPPDLRPFGSSEKGGEATPLTKSPAYATDFADFAVVWRM